MISPPFSRQQHGLYNKTAEEDWRACGAGWSEPPMTPYLVLETSTSGLVLKRPVPSEVPSMQASSISCRASKQCCPKFATGGVMIWCWRSWQRWQSHAYRRLTADPPLQWNFQSCLQGLGRTPTPLNREKMQDSSQPAVFPREIIKASLWPDLAVVRATQDLLVTVPWEEGLEAANKRKQQIYIYIYLYNLYVFCLRNNFPHEANSVNLFFAGLFQQTQVCSKTVVNTCSDCIRSGPFCVWCKQLVREKLNATCSNWLVEARVNGFDDDVAVNYITWFQW